MLLSAGSPGQPGPPLEVTVVSDTANEVLGQGRFRAGYADPTEQAVGVGRVAGEQRIAVCVRNAGRHRVGLYGNADAAARTSRAFLGNRGLDTDLTLVFARSEPRSMLSALPDIFERATVFRPGWVGPWLYWALAAAVLAGVPLLLARALRRRRAPYARPVTPARSRALSAARSPAST